MIFRVPTIRAFIIADLGTSPAFGNVWSFSSSLMASRPMSRVNMTFWWNGYMGDAENIRLKGISEISPNMSRRLAYLRTSDV